ncbi:MAG: phospholipid scramblase-related protein, partial [Bdellovibrionales bacterium]
MYGIKLDNMKSIFVHQVHELGEWFGFETRNKYEIFDENKNSIGFAAEQSKGFWGFLARQFLGHWRSFEIHFFSSQRQLAFIAHHPFRWYFQRLEVKDSQGQTLG